MSLLKIRDFPSYNRGPPARHVEFKTYLKKHKSEPPELRFADFNLLLYIAEILDIDTSIKIAE